MPGIDIAVVGAGPGGARTATLLARAGARVTLFDGSHPREKPCGGGVTGRALEKVSTDLPPNLPATVVSEVRFEAAGRPPVDVSLETGTGSRCLSLIVASRTAFDGALLKAAGRAGVTLAATRVLDIGRSSRRFVLETTGGRHTCDWLVGADGVNSLVRRRVWRPFARAQLTIASGVYADGVTSRRIAIRFSSDPPGYLWSFPRPDHLAIGACAPAGLASAADLQRTAADWFRNSDSTPAARLRPYSWPIPSLGQADLQVERPAGSRWLLVGDAAGLVDPITREGIFFAVESAGLAAAALTSERDPERGYVARIREGPFRELDRAAGMARGFFSAGFTHLLLGALEDSRAIRDLMVDLVGGRQSYRGLRRRVLGTMELRFAFESAIHFARSRG